MRGALPVVTLVVIAALLLPVIAGCGRSRTGEGSTPALGGAMPEAVNNAAVQPPLGQAPAEPPPVRSAQPSSFGGPVMQLLGRRDKVTSYKLSMTGYDGYPINLFVKLSAGKTTMMKSVVGKVWAMTDLEHSILYTYHPGMKAVLKTSMGGTGPMSERSMNPAMSPDGDPRVLATRKPEVSEVSLDGVPCLLFVVTNSPGHIARAWIDKQYGLPRRIEKGGRITQFKYAMINSVPDSTFQLPAGVKVKDVTPPAPVPAKPRR